MRLLQAHLAYDAYDLPDETNAAAFVERKMEQLEKAAAASQIKNEKKEKKRSLPQESTGEVSFDDYQALLRDEGLAGDFRARAGSRDAIVSRPYCKPKSASATFLGARLFHILIIYVRWISASLT